MTAAEVKGPVGKGGGTENLPDTGVYFEGEAEENMTSKFLEGWGVGNSKHFWEIPCKGNKDTSRRFQGWEGQEDLF